MTGLETSLKKSKGKMIQTVETEMMMMMVETIEMMIEMIETIEMIMMETIETIEMMMIETIEMMETIEGKRNWKDRLMKFALDQTKKIRKSAKDSLKN